MKESKMTSFKRMNQLILKISDTQDGIMIVSQLPEVFSFKCSYKETP